jgi:acyl-coenzyme A synthetase/AMP-(fatty) acid ligase
MCAEATMLVSSLPRVTRTGCVLSTVPNHHLYGLTFRGFWAFQQGLKVSLNQLQNPEEIAAAVMKQAQSAQEPIVLVTTPSQLTRVPDLVGYGPLHVCQTIFTAGSPLPEGVTKTLAAHQIFPQEIFGSTETGALAHRRQSECRAWEPLHGVNLIWQESICTVEAPWIDGSWPISDRLVPLPDGKFELGGRADRVVKIGEKRVDLESLEARLRKHPWVADVAVTTVQRQRLSLGAIIVLSPVGLAIQETEKNVLMGQHLRLYLANTYDRVMTPKYWRYVAELPYDERGKLNQLQLRRYFDEELTLSSE